MPNAFIIAASLTLVAAPAAASVPSTTATSDRNVEASYDAAKDQYCLRLKSQDPTLPLSLRIYQRSCKTAIAWAAEGVTVSRRARS